MATVTTPCYHYGLSESGICPKCSHWVDVSENWTYSIGSSANEASVSGAFTFECNYPEDLQSVLSYVFGCYTTDVRIDSVRPQQNGAILVSFRIGDNGAQMRMTVRWHVSDKRNPVKVEMTDKTDEVPE